MIEPLIGYKKVAVCEFPGIVNHQYYFALYDYEAKSVMVGDEIAVSGGRTTDVPVIVEIISIDEAVERCNKPIISEVICRIDTSGYRERMDARNKKRTLRAKLDNKKRELMKTTDDEFFANMDEEFAAMLHEYNGINL